ncbi:hypothetical protein KM043_005199 [Ampulex compressa]|nr:hypothetical protein KM043_005199 [Ampulex compressa]
MKPRAHLYPDNEEPYDQRDENCISSDEDMSHYCEVCDRDFPTEAKLSEHKSQHKLCGIDGCTFSANPMLVERHISMQHSSGLYQRMKNLSTPEDIQKWIMERKKRYPTKANIALQKAAESEKLQRGEIIKQKSTSVLWKSKIFENSQSRKRKQHRRSVQTFNYVIPKKELYRGLHAFSGTMHLRELTAKGDSALNEITSNVSNEEYTLHISDEEDDIISTTLLQTTSSPRVTSLVANYGSDSEDSCADDAPEEQPIKRMKDTDQDSGTAICEAVSSGVNKNLEINTNIRVTQNVNCDIVENKKSRNLGKQNAKSPRMMSNRKDVKYMDKKYPQRLQLLQRLHSAFFL